MKKVYLCFVAFWLVSAAWSDPFAQEKPPAKPGAAPSPLTVSKQQAERLQIADNLVMLKRNDLALAQIGREALEADTLAEMGLDIKVWTLVFRDGKYEAVKREPVKPPTAKP